MIQPDEIIEEIKKLPLLQQEVAGKRYIKTEASWKLQLASINKVNNGQLLVFARAKDSYNLVGFYISLKKYPQFEALSRGDDLWVNGEISKIKGDIWLKNCTVKFNHEIIDHKPLKEKLEKEDYHGEEINTSKPNTSHTKIFETMNKPVIVALLIIILGALGFLIKYYFFPEKGGSPIKFATSNGQSGGITAAEINYYQATTSDMLGVISNNLSPYKIMNNLVNLDPRQRQAVAKSYEGQDVNWETTFYLSGSTWTILVPKDKKGSDSSQIDCDVGEEKYPELKLFNKSDAVVVSGIISSVESGKINLKNCKLTF